jgi:dehydrogenase/reductase SDR family protein 12
MNKLAIAGFTNVGYLFHSRSFEQDLPDMAGKTVLITGGSSGLGLAAAQRLSSLGARLMIVGRSESRLEAALTTLTTESAAVSADLSLLSEVNRLADQLIAAEETIDVLVNNVGVLLPEREVTGEGLERTLATNLAGHFALTNRLAPLLVASAPARVVNVSSGGMYAERIRPNDLQFEKGEYRGTIAYARTKRGQVILTEMWAGLLEGTGVVVHSMHPGWARTDGVERSLPTFNRVMKPFLRSPAQGADTIAWLAASREAGRSTGRFWFDRSEAPTHMSSATRETPSERELLWQSLVELTSTDMTAVGLDSQ